MSSGDMAAFSPMILACRGQGCPRQYVLAVWIPFILSLGTSSSLVWALGLRWNRLNPLGPSGPTIAPQNHAARLFGRGGGF